jgi:flagellar assembly protein FliH
MHWDGPGAGLPSSLRFPVSHAAPQLAGLSSPDLEAALEARLRQETQCAYRQGEEAGRQAAGLELEPVLRKLAISIEEIASMRPRLRRQAERDVVELALAVARRVLRRQVETDPDALAGLVKAALEKQSLREVSVVRVHPRFLASTENQLRQIGTPSAVRIEADTRLEPGAVLVETASGELDASVETQLDEISRGFADSVGARR